MIKPMFLLVISLLVAAIQTHQTFPGYKLGEEVNIQCKTAQGNWGQGPTCVETGKPINFHFGHDMLQACTWGITSDEDYEHFKRLITREETWSCRVEVGPGVDFYLPFFIPIWGVVEDTHIHIDTHLNFVFHGDNYGHIMGGAAYPVQDHFQPVQKGTYLKIHGPVKWFKGHYFHDFSPNSVFASSSSTDILPVLLMWSLVSIMLTAVIAVSYYQCCIKPRLVRKLLKQD
eukprot:TRINITY_DN1362_c0_g1_i1.p1 TRINITY_DN1362_c0_g1~~TRINITY_DN1362_c0_g1_i1.p1  ORF type:complete len:230 (-),score=30.83 TRINITY_DN1362_c0_g1_i1:18-707(-)